MTAPTFRQSAAAWAEVAAQSFGGPAAQIAVMHRVFVEQRRFIDEASFLAALQLCMILPGPEAQQLITWIGWRQHGLRGGLVAGWLFVLPGFLSLMALSVLTVGWGHTPAVGGLLFGLKAAVLALLVEAITRLSRRALQGRAMVLLAGISLLARFLGVPFPLLILGAGLFGALRAPASPEPAAPLSWGGPLRVAAIGLPLWLGPVAILAVITGPSSIWTELGLFFAQAATLTFGGAYAVLGWVAEHAVADRGWLSTAEMMDGLGLAESTPGPLIQVVQHVGFLAASRSPGGLHALVAGALGATLTTWVTFAPSFLWIFALAPQLEALRARPRWAAAVGAISAVVVGVVVELGLQFAKATLYRPDHALPIDLLALGIAITTGLALHRWPKQSLRVLAGAALVGIAAHSL